MRRLQAIFSKAQFAHNVYSYKYEYAIGDKKKYHTRQRWLFILYGEEEKIQVCILETVEFTFHQIPLKFLRSLV